jgi:hypothetical protein
MGDGRYGMRERERDTKRGKREDACLDQEGNARGWSGADAGPDTAGGCELARAGPPQWPVASGVGVVFVSTYNAWRSGPTGVSGVESRLGAV